MLRYLIPGSLVVIGMLCGLVYTLSSGATPGPARLGDETRQRAEGADSEVDGPRGHDARRAGAVLDRARVASLRPVTHERPALATVTSETEEMAGGEAGSEASSATTPSLAPAEEAMIIDRRFASEADDPAWSHDAARRLSAGISNGLPEGTTIGNLVCRSSLCRIESSHASRDAFKSYVESTLLDSDRIGWNAAIAAIVTEESSEGVKALSFVAREGRDVPSVYGDD